MVNEEKYFIELQKILGETRSADIINERWNEVLERFDQLAIEYAREIQAGTGVRYVKDGQARDILLFPPHRLLAMNLILSYWLGWLSIPKSLHLVSDWSRIQDAYHKGKSNNVLKAIAHSDDADVAGARTAKTT
ncbi:MAG: hypothetical protein GEU26_16725 [Nitrososphaeraceae archaeon]|nr:hypothetical protein [Nitrososphaeraceae archaeon]